MSWLLILALVLLMVLLALWAGRFVGRASVTKDNSEVKDEQLKEATFRPDKSALTDELRDGKF